MSGDCPVDCPTAVRWWCPILSDNCPVSVRWCPVMSGPDWTVQRFRLSEVSDLVSGHVRCCPVLSNAVRYCHIYCLSCCLYGPLVYKYYQNTLSARAKGCVAELGCKSTLKSRCPQNIYEYMDSAQNQYHLSRTSLADSDLTSKFKGTLLMKMVGDFSA